MDGRTLQDLQFARIVEAASSRSQTARGRALLATLRELPGPAAAKTELVLVDQAAALLALPDHPTLDGVEDVGSQVESAARGGVLTAAELVACARLLRRAHEAFSLLADLRLRAPELAASFGNVKDHLAIAERIEETFDEDNRIRDDASPRLGELRSRVVHLGRRVKERIESMLRDPAVREVLQDDYYTLREGRYVLPVRAEDHRFVPGIIHGTSRTGATHFVEPAAIVDDNNQLKLVLDQIEVEEYAVLADRSGLIGRFAPDVRDLMSACWRLDSILARGRLGRDLHAALPDVGAAGGLRLIDARNPVLLLLGRDVVPVGLDLAGGGGRGSALVVSGPNAGGKSVTLSTIGLCCAMVRHGLLPPVQPDSAIPWHDHVLTLMGDPENMDRAVSTFTGQLARIREAFDRGPGRALLLLDELATGTEPHRGEALAVATLRDLVEGGAECVVTTHYDALKRLAAEDDRFVNARVGLDGRSGLPNYRLETGASGESNPFEVAASVKFPARVLERAKSLVDQRQRRLDEALAETERLKADLAREKSETEALSARLTGDKRRYEKELARLRGDADRLVYEARKDVLQKMKRLEDELDQIAKDARAEAAKTEARRTADRVVVRRQEVRDKQAQVKRDMDREAPLVEDVPAEPLPAADLVPGRKVFVFPLRAEGTVVEVAADGKRATVQVGLMKIQTRLADLREPRPAAARASNTPRAAGGGVNAAGRARAGGEPAPSGDEVTFVRSERNTVDCRGMRADEAKSAVDKKLDEAFLAEEPVVLVIHGMGTSALRNAVREYLKTSRYVRSFRPGDVGEGGEGVTIVTL